MYIKRNIEESIKKIIDTFPVLMITGPRQVGKTTVLRELLKNQDYKYITLDNPFERQLAKEDPKMFLEKHGDKIIIDEFQYAPDLLIYIKMEIDNKRFKALEDDSVKPNGRYILTGSQMFRMMKGVTESLAGRVGILNLYGLSNSEIDNYNSKPFVPTAEYLKSRKISHSININQLYERILRGSFPALIENKNLDLETFYSGYIQTYLERDVRDLINIGNENKFLKFISCIAARTSQELNYNDIAKDVEIDINTAKNWLSILETSGLIFLLNPYSNNDIKRLIKRPKLYFMDTGLACFLSRYKDADTLEISHYSGAIYETFIVTEIIKSFVNAGKLPYMNLYYYRDRAGKEIDLLIIENGTIHPIEIKKSSNPNKNMIKNFAVLDNINLKIGEGGIVCNLDSLYPIDEKNYYIPINYI